LSGVKAPAEGGKCWTVWAELDKLVGKGAQPTLRQALGIAEANGWNLNNTRIEFYQWRHFHGYGKILQDQVDEKRHADRRVRKARPRAATTERRHESRRAVA